MTAIIILAAGQGTRLKPFTDNTPKCMLPVHDRPILHWQLNAIRSLGITDIVVVGGYRNESIIAPDTVRIYNPEYRTTNMVQSLWCARQRFSTGFITSYGDIVYNADILKQLMDADGDICVVVDRAWKPYWNKRTDTVLDDIESLTINPDTGLIQSIGQKVRCLDEVEGQYIGLTAFRRDGIQNVREYMSNHSIAKMYGTDLLQGLINEGVSVTPVWIDGGWFEVDTMRDWTVAESISKVNGKVLVIGRSVV